MAQWVFIASTLLAFFVLQDNPLWAGFMLGLLVGGVNWQGLATATRRAVQLSSIQAQRYMFKNYLFRYFLRFAVLAVGLIYYELNPITLLLGLTFPTLFYVVAYFVRRK